VYFYVLDEEERLIGVLPARRLLVSSLDKTVGDMMVRGTISLREETTVLEACEAFAQHRFLALPVVDDAGRITGVVDLGLFTAAALDAAGKAEMDELFETIGFRASQVRDASPWRAFRFRFPWLLTNLTSGVLCALLTSRHALTLEKSIVLAFFLTLVLGLGESVSIQSMSVTVQALRVSRPTWGWFFSAALRELAVALLLGAACGGMVGAVVWFWHKAGMAAVSIGGSVLLAVTSACLLGLTIPALLHALKLDWKISAGPVSLALADLATLAIYFGVAARLL
jgi:magnesium transporter